MKRFTYTIMIALFAAALLVPATAARAEVAPMPAQPALSQTEEHKAVQQEISNLNGHLKAQKKLVRKCKGKGKKRTCRDRVVQLPLPDDEYSSAEEDFAEAVEELRELIYDRASERSEAADEWLEERAEQREDAIQAAYEKAVDDADVAYETRVDELEAKQHELEASVERTYEIWVVTNQPPSPDLISDNQEVCLQMIYGANAVSIPAKPAKPARPKLHGKWPRRQPRKKNKNGKVTAAYRKWVQDRDKMNGYRKQVNRYKADVEVWKEENGAYASCLDTENDADAEAWRESQLAAFAEAIEYELGKAEKVRDAAVEAAERVMARASAQAERANNRDQRDTERALAKIEKREEKAVTRLERTGEKLLNKLAG